MQKTNPAKQKENQQQKQLASKNTKPWKDEEKEKTPAMKSRNELN